MSPNRAAVLSAFAAHRCSAILRTHLAGAVRPALDAAVQGGFRIVEVLRAPAAEAVQKRVRSLVRGLTEAHPIRAPRERQAALPSAIRAGRRGAHLPGARQQPFGGR